MRLRFCVKSQNTFLKSGRIRLFEVLARPSPQPSPRGRGRKSMTQTHSLPPSALSLTYLIAALVSLIGLGDAVYLTVQHITGASLRCTIISGCSEVLSSPYAQVGPVPLAAVGAAAYFVVFSLAILAAFGYPS